MNQCFPTLNQIRTTHLCPRARSTSIKGLRSRPLSGSAPSNYASQQGRLACSAGVRHALSPHALLVPLCFHPLDEVGALGESFSLKPHGAFDQPAVVLSVHVGSIDADIPQNLQRLLKTAHDLTEPLGMVSFEQ